MFSGKLFIVLFVLLVFLGCKKQDQIIYPNLDRTISIADSIKIDNGVNMKNPIFNYVTYENFLNYLSTSDHFLIVPLKDFKSTTS